MVALLAGDFRQTPSEGTLAIEIMHVWGNQHYGCTEKKKRVTTIM